jgi:hypothetical protein
VSGVVTAEYYRARYCAWLGAVVARLRAGVGVVPRGDGYLSDRIERDAASFGLPLGLHVTGTTDSEDTAVHGILEEVYRAGIGKRWEESLWSLIILWCPYRFPKQIALDFIERDLCVCALGHSLQEEEVWWRIGDRIPEAAENLAIHRWTRPEFDGWRVEEVLSSFDMWDRAGDRLAPLRSDPPERAAWLARRIRELGLTEKVNHWAPDVPRHWTEEFSTAWEEITPS